MNNLSKSRERQGRGLKVGASSACLQVQMEAGMIDRSGMKQSVSNRRRRQGGGRGRSHGQVLYDRVKNLGFILREFGKF